MTTFKCPNCHQELVVKTVGDSAKMRRFDHDEALALLRFGATQTEVAKIYGVTPSAIGRIKKRST